MDRGYKIPPHILDDLCSRFILNIPDDYREDKIRLFFQIELAHWFYIDFFVAEDSNLRIVGIKEFASQVFNHCPFLNSNSNDLDAMHQDWKAYKLTVPTYGVVLVDPTDTYVLLVQGFSKSWGFPKGKVNEDEDAKKCALRELLEETGFDAAGRINTDDYVQHTVGDQYSRLYIVPGIPLETNFLPTTRNEIKAMKWWPIEYLPTHKKDVSHSKELGCGPNSFFMVIPYLKQIKRWICQKRSGNSQTTPKSQYKSRLSAEAKKGFAQRSLQEFEEILKTDEEASGTIGGDRKSGRNQRATSIGSPHKSRNQSPLSSPMERRNKRQSNLNVSKRHKEFDQSSSPIGPSLTGQFDSPITGLDCTTGLGNAFTPCQAWQNFTVDIDDVMTAVYGPSC